MRLVHDDRVVAQELRIALDFGQQDAVGHDLDQRGGTDLVCEAHLVADGAAEFDAELLRQAIGHRARCDPARLRVPDRAVDSAAKFEADLGDLGGLTGAGFAGDDHNLVVADGSGNVLPAGRDWQLGRVGDFWNGGQPRCDQFGARGERAAPGAGALAVLALGAGVLGAGFARALFANSLFARSFGTVGARATLTPTRTTARSASASALALRGRSIRGRASPT